MQGSFFAICVVLAVTALFRGSDGLPIGVSNVVPYTPKGYLVTHEMGNYDWDLKKESEKLKGYADTYTKGKDDLYVIDDKESHSSSEERYERKDGHGHGYGHKHSHDHRRRKHSHKHSHSHEHESHEHGSHEHGSHEHCQEHSHEHSHGHSHERSREHSCEHDHDHGYGSGGFPY